MAEEGDDSADKTEAPSPRRLERAREQGNVALSKEATGFAVLMLASIGAFAGLPLLGQALLQRLRGVLAHAHQLDPLATLRDLLLPGLLTILPIAGAAAVAAVAATLLQTGGLFSAHGLAPKLSKLSPLAGLKRLFGAEALVEFGRNLAKLAVVALALRSALADPVLLQSVLQLSPAALLAAAAAQARSLVIAALMAFAGIALLDLLWVRFRLHRQLRMSRQDIREEMKESEGDPHVKGRQKQIRIQRSRKRMLSAVPRAAVVITNPTHFAVALAYDGEGDSAPMLVAKGVDSLAARIREAATAAGVPIVENPPLARALYRAELDTPIPADHYQAVAEIIAFVWRARGRAAGPAG
jgi:flagellar biosynthetic protein FlhB